VERGWHDTNILTDEIHLSSARRRTLTIARNELSEARASQKKRKISRERNLSPSGKPTKSDSSELIAKTTSAFVEVDKSQGQHLNIGTASMSVVGALPSMKLVFLIVHLGLLLPPRVAHSKPTQTDYGATSTLNNDMASGQTTSFDPSPASTSTSSSATSQFQNDPIRAIHYHFHQEMDPFMHLHKFTPAQESTTDGNNVTCNDGTPAGYYKRLNNHSKSWIIYLQGGGYCGSEETCQLRWRRSAHLMSSSLWPRSMSGKESGDGVDAAFRPSAGNHGTRKGARRESAGDQTKRRRCRQPPLVDEHGGGEFAGTCTRELSDTPTNNGSRVLLCELPERRRRWS
jgi:hypothetical protein